MSSTDSTHSCDGADAVRIPTPAAAAVQGDNEPGQGPPLLDFSVLTELEEDAGGRVAQAFVSDYVRIWHKRIDFLARSLKEGSIGSVRNALLSLKGSALMVGAPRLASQADTLEHLAAEGDLAATRSGLPCLLQTGELTVNALVRSYLQPKPQCSTQPARAPDGTRRHGR